MLLSGMNRLTMAQDKRVEKLQQPQNRPRYTMGCYQLSQAEVKKRWKRIFLLCPLVLNMAVSASQSYHSLQANNIKPLAGILTPVPHTIQNLTAKVTVSKGGLLQHVPTPKPK